MKTIAMACVLAVFSTLSHAQYTGPSTVPVAMTVGQIQESGKDDQRVLLRGRIVKYLGDEKYQFTDGTGEIQVEIDHDLWPSGQPISEKSEVELVGKYDKELIGKSEVEVKSIKVLQQ